MLTAVRTVDIDLIEPIQETPIEAKEKGKNNFLGGKNVAWPVFKTI